MENKFYNIKLSPEMAHNKIKNWCAYQERSQFETRQKLVEYGLFTEDVEQIIAKLIEENYLNEERFAFALVSGKFNIKQWGKIKIKIELKKHKVSDYLISRTLNSIDEELYAITLKKVIDKKQRLTSEKNKQKLIQKLIQHAISKGFESDLVVEEVKEIVQAKSKI
ncbi:MAG: regulatory protein RecX [Bacteroidota bacterium]|nr:regulatory protein RecX [Bacteroidota bacterium]